MVEGQILVEEYKLENTKHKWDLKKIKFAHRVLVKYDNSSNLIEGTCTVGTDQASLLYYTNDRHCFVKKHFPSLKKLIIL